MDLRSFIAASTGLVTVSQLFDQLDSYLKAMSFEFFSYHITAAHLRRLNLEVGFIFNNFPQDWVAHYTAQKYYAYDPVILTAAVHEEPFHWFEVGKIADLTQRQSDYLKDLTAWGFKDGVAIPIFGAKGRTAYFGAGSKSSNIDLNPAELTQVQYACNYAHKRYLELHGAFDGPTPDLTKREIEVISWIAKGKSTGVIAELLGVTAHTIDTLTRRVYKKLGVNDRVSAVLKAVGMGIITL